jgi:CRP/FNR family cyclic AMP-dependent transcriptional regulator
MPDAIYDGLSTGKFRFVALGIPKNFAKKTLVLEEGRPGDTFYILLSGHIRIFTEEDGADGNARRLVIGAFGPGTIFGEGALIGGMRDASVEAISDITCTEIDCMEFKSQVSVDPRYAMTLLTDLISRSRLNTQQMKSLALKTVYQRLRELMVTGSILENGVRTFGPEMTQQEIAHRIGSSRDMITKIFKDLAKGGYIELTHGKPVILKELPKAW